MDISCLKVSQTKAFTVVKFNLFWFSARYISLFCKYFMFQSEVNEVHNDVL